MKTEEILEASRELRAKAGEKFGKKPKEVSEPTAPPDQPPAEPVPPPDSRPAVESSPKELDRKKRSRKEKKKEKQKSEPPAQPVRDGGEGTSKSAKDDKWEKYRQLEARLFDLEKTIGERTSNLKGRWNKIKEALGYQIPEIGNEELNQYRHELDEIREQIRREGGSILKQDSRAEDIVHLNKWLLESEIRIFNHETEYRRQSLTGKLFDRYAALGDWWQAQKGMKGFMKKQGVARIVWGAGLGLGLAVTGGLGAASYGTMSRLFSSVFAGSMAAVGRKAIEVKKHITDLEKKNEEKARRQAKIMLQFAEDQWQEKFVHVFNISKESADFHKKQREHSRRAVKTFLKTTVTALAIGEVFRAAANSGIITKESTDNFFEELVGLRPFEYITGYKGPLKEARLGGATGAKPEVSQEILYNKDGTLTKIGEEYFKQYDAEPFDSPKKPESHYARGHIIDDAGKSPAVGVDAEVPADFRDSSSLSQAESGLQDLRAPDAPAVTAEMAPETVELGSDTIKKGGSFWRSTENLIRANPEKYGLDPESKTFVRDARRMTTELLHKLAREKGINYAELDELARRGVQPGDIVKIVKDPNADNIKGMRIEYSGKAFAELSDVKKPDSFLAVDPEPAPESPKESQAVSAGEVHHPVSKSAAGTKTMAEIEADHQQDLARRASDRAARAAEYTREVNARKEALSKIASYEATHRQALASRGALNRLIETAGISKNYIFWNEPAEKWYENFQKSKGYIAEDVIESDAVGRTNNNLKIFKDLYKALGKPKPGQTNWEYLLEKMKDSRTAAVVSGIIYRK